jgi:amino acid adenylation domain-containing protein
MADHEVYEFPCALSQQRLWIDDRLTPGNPFYNIHACLRVPSVLEPARLEGAVAGLIHRHETLRTTFVERDGSPVQRVAAEGRCDFRALDLRTWPPAERDAQVLALAHAQATEPFDLERGPLLRVRWVRVGATEGVLMLTVHHIVADAWSMGILLREITALYGQAAGGPPAALPELPIQFADYAVWQQGEGSRNLDRALAYWREQLRELPTLELPTDRPRPAVASHRGCTLHFGLDAEASARVIDFARQGSVTTYVVLLAALAVVLQRNAGQDDVVVGAPVAGRDRPELEGLIGFFVNTLVLRLDLAGEPGFEELAQHVQKVLRDALAHQELPFERLVQVQCQERDLSRNPLFQVSVQYLASPESVVAAGGPATTLLEVQRGATNFDLSFDFWRAGDRIEGRVDFATDLFDAATVERWVAQWQRVLDQGLAQPLRSIASIELLGAEERALILGPWSGSDFEYPRDAHIAALWSRIVGSRADAPAVRAGDQVWTYARLDAESRRVAGALAVRGLQHGQAVGIALPRGPMQIAALLAALRLGAAYVALDPAWPDGRIDHCLQAAAICCVVCDAVDAPAWSARGVAALFADDLPPVPELLPAVSIDPLDPAYVAFTSGSTGLPKGVVVPHRAVLRLVCGNPQVPLSSDDTMLVYAPLAFDASTLEIWGPLLQGGCLSLPPARPLGLDELALWIESEHITAAWLTAGLFHQLAAAHPAVLARIRRLYCGGDVLSGDALRSVFAQGDGHSLVCNGYGPTENTTFTCVHAMRYAADVGDPVPIGRPIAGGHVRVVDRRGRLVPPGVAGELLVGGDGLALGYLGDSDLTAQKFVADPIDATRRVYRTGDRVRWRADGLLEFLGRIDRQLKVRGYRVEPGEVEAALRALPGVRDAHVGAVSDRSGDKHLVAHLAVAPGLTGAALARQLSVKLPAWMVPSEWHLHDALVLNANGKVDPAALLAAMPPDEEAGSGSNGLDGEIESLVAQVWADVLGSPVHAPQANFFVDLGGHSLLATQVVSRLNAALGIALPLAAIFEAPSVRGVAMRVEALLLADMGEAA